MQAVVCRSDRGKWVKLPIKAPFEECYVSGSIALSIAKVIWSQGSTAVAVSVVSCNRSRWEVLPKMWLWPFQSHLEG